MESPSCRMREILKGLQHTAEVLPLRAPAQLARLHSKMPMMPLAMAKQALTPKKTKAMSLSVCVFGPMSAQARLPETMASGLLTDAKA